MPAGMSEFLSGSSSFTSTVPMVGSDGSSGSGSGGESIGVHPRQFKVVSHLVRHEGSPPRGGYDSSNEAEGKPRRDQEIFRRKRDRDDEATAAAAAAAGRSGDPPPAQPCTKADADPQSSPTVASLPHPSTWNAFPSPTQPRYSDDSGGTQSYPHWHSPGGQLHSFRDSFLLENNDRDEMDIDVMDRKPPPKKQRCLHRTKSG